MIYKVELMVFGKGQIRLVEIPEKDNIKINQNSLLDLIYICGQNNRFDNQKLPSVSKGDIINIDDKRFIVKSHGFEEIDETKYLFLKWVLKQSIENERKYSDLLYEALGNLSFEYC